MTGTGLEYQQDDNNVVETMQVRIFLGGGEKARQR